MAILVLISSGVINTYLLVFQRLQRSFTESPDFSLPDFIEQMTYNESILFQTTIIPCQYQHSSLIT